MFRRIHLIVAALAMMIAPLAMQSGAVAAAMPMDHHEMAKANHCGDTEQEGGDAATGKTQCCVAMCSALAPPGAAWTDQIDYHESLRFSLASTEHRPVLAKLPTPPPRAA